MLENIENQLLVAVPRIRKKGEPMRYSNKAT